MNVFVQLYLYVRTIVLVMMVKYGIRKNAAACWSCPVAYDKARTVIESLRLPADKEAEVKEYLWQEIQKQY